LLRAGRPSAAVAAATVALHQPPAATQRMPTADGESAYCSGGGGDGELPVTPAVAQAALDLQMHGWAVVEDVILREECEAYIDRVWGCLEGLGTGAPPPRC